ncbi:MAG: Xaa-Pro aminopeptidase, partial [Sphaerochaeta sp.]|nr:Xaa-Pro aminopeptidase [Sphaerochaeta sp.]
MSVIDERVGKLRSLMSNNNLDGWIINGTDPHQSEYVCDRWKSRAWISGFTGSAGTVLITQEDALLWVDSRYFIQAGQQIEGTCFQMMKIDTPSYPDPSAYLKEHLQKGSRIGIDKATLTVKGEQDLQKAFKEVLDLVPFDDLLEQVWQDRSEVPAKPVSSLPDDIAGFSRSQKLAMVRYAMVQQGASYTVISSLDDIAWITNLRGDDVPYNPVFLAYLVIGKTDAWLFTNPRRFTDALSNDVSQDFTILPYQDVVSTLKRVLKERDVLYFNPEKTNLLIAETFGGIKTVTGLDFTTELKACKNDTEMEGMRKAHLLDGVALVNFLSRLDTKQGTYTEIAISNLLKEQRMRNPDCIGESFSPISGWAEHGAICHYSATEESNLTVEGNGLLVLDTGGMYTFGMTDVTRTILFGEPTDEQIRDYTLVLKGNLAIASARFPEGTCGYQLDALARQFLWQQGMSYFHGTGHGIGFRLNV